MEWTRDLLNSQIFDFVNDNSFLWWGVGIIAIAIPSIILFLRRHNKTFSSQLEIVLSSISTGYFKDIIIPDGMGGLLEIEHLFLTDRGLLLLESYEMSGNLFGSKEIDLWTQIVDGKSFRFPNPIRRLNGSRQALKSLVPTVPIYCRIVFGESSVFPKGKPDEVLLIDKLSSNLVKLKVQTDSQVEKNRQAWDRISRIARKNGQSAGGRGDK